MQRIIISIVVLMTLCGFDVGSSDAILTCSSDSGRTTFNAEMQDINSILQKAVLTIDDTTVEYMSDDGHIIFDPENGVLTMNIDEAPRGNSPRRNLEFWAIPATFKTIKNTNGHQIYEFKAKIFGSEIRPDKELHMPTITLNCRLEYKI